MPEKTALVCGEQRLGYPQLARAADGLAAHLRAGGVLPGDRVLVCVPNSAETVIAIYGVLRAGACLVLAEGDSTAEQLSYRLNHSGAKVLITAEPRMPMVHTALASVDNAPMLIVAGELGTSQLLTSFADACATAPTDALEIDPDAPAILLYTSGSTGRPKGVTLTRRSVGSVVAAVGEYLGHTPDDTTLCVLQLAFGYGLLQVLVTFDTCGTLVLRHGFGMPFDIVTTIEAERVTGLAGVPTLFALLMQLRSLDTVDCSSLRYITNAAAALPQALVHRVRAAFPSAALYLMHGQTECLRTTYLPPDQLDARPTSVGKGMPGVDLWLEDPEGNVVPNGGEGELIARGKNVMLGYWNDPEATALVVRPGRTPDERVLRTRDIFRSDADGYLYFVSRTDDIIKTRGEKVSPFEIEELLFAHDDVLEARVIGVPDDVLGQAIRAEVVVRPGHQPTEVDLRRYLRAHLQPHKVPQVIEFVESLPKSSGGKVRRTL